MLVPPAVITELSKEQTPAIVQQWIARPPDWVQVQGPIRDLVPLDKSLHAGERAAIALAEELSADALLIDERDGRRGIDNNLAGAFSADPARRNW